jgi:hypothetical protein
MKIKKSNPYPTGFGYPHLLVKIDERFIYSYILGMNL